MIGTTQSIFALLAREIGRIRGSLPVHTIVPSASLTADLALDSLDLEELFAFVRQSVSEVDLTPWFVRAGRAGGDSLGSLVEYLSLSQSEECTVPTEPNRTPDYVRLAKELAQTFSQRAEGFDRRAEFPSENFKDMMRTGYTAMTVPRSFGGGGADLETLCRAQEALAAGCASTAWAINMHLHGLAMLNMFAGEEMEWVYDAVVQRGGIIAGGFSEPGVGGNWWYPTTRAVPRQDGYVLNGKKSFFTGFPAANLLFLTAAIEDERGSLLPAGFLVPNEHASVRVVAPWDAFGMRATGSDSLAITDLFVHRRYMVGKPGQVPMMFMKGVHWAWCSFASVFVGIAAGALDYVVKTMAERRLEVIKKPLSHLPGIQFRVAEMKVRLEAMRAMLYRAARKPDVSVDEGIDHYIEMSLMKMSACQLAHETVTMGLQVIGGSGFLSSNPIQRMYRDVSAGLLVPPSADLVLEWAGKRALDIPVLGEPRWGE